MVVWSCFLHQPHAVANHLQAHCCMWLLIFKIILYNPTALNDWWRVISPFSVPGLHLLLKNSVICSSVMAPFWSSHVWWQCKTCFGAAQYSGVLVPQPGSRKPFVCRQRASWCWLEYTFHSHYTHNRTFPLYVMTLHFWNTHFPFTDLHLLTHLPSNKL